VADAIIYTATMRNKVVSYALSAKNLLPVTSSENLLADVFTPHPSIVQISDIAMSMHAGAGNIDH
jgi:hypothetical protein